MRALSGRVFVLRLCVVRATIIGYNHASRLRLTDVSPETVPRKRTKWPKLYVSGSASFGIHHFRRFNDRY